MEILRGLLLNGKFTMLSSFHINYNSHMLKCKTLIGVFIIEFSHIGIVNYEYNIL